VPDPRSSRSADRPDPRSLTRSHGSGPSRAVEEEQQHHRGATAMPNGTRNRLLKSTPVAVLNVSPISFGR
jgi:hypothetical protein